MFLSFLSLSFFCCFISNIKIKWRPLQPSATDWFHLDCGITTITELLTLLRERVHYRSSVVSVDFVAEALLTGKTDISKASKTKQQSFSLQYKLREQYPWDGLPSKVGSHRVQKLWYFEFVISKLISPTIHMYHADKESGAAFYWIFSRNAIFSN